MKLIPAIKFMLISSSVILTSVVIYSSMRSGYTRPSEHLVNEENLKQSPALVSPLSFLPTPQTNTSRSSIQASSGIEPEHSKGYVLILRGKEQLTSGTASLLSQSCMFKKISSTIQMVEPFIDGSYYGFNPVIDGTGNLKSDIEQISLFDAFDRKDIEATIKAENIAPFIDFQTFIEKAPRDTILVDNNNPSDERETTDLRDRVNTAFQPYGFNIIKTVRLDFYTGGALTDSGWCIPRHILR